MKIISVAKDGGPASPVTGFFVCEFKSWFSIVILKFNKGCREAFHSHAFNAYTWWLKGRITEHHLTGEPKKWKPSIKPKYTPRSCFHKVLAHVDTYALSFRGPWVETWQEYKDNTYITLTHGRKEVMQ